MIAYVRIGSLYDLIYFFIGYCIHGITETVILACFHLYDGNGVIPLCYDVEFLVPESPIAIAYRISSCHKVGNCTIFANFSEFVVLCHRTLCLAEDIR